MNSQNIRVTLQTERVPIDVQGLQRTVALQRFGQQPRARVARQVAADVERAQPAGAAQRVQ